MLSKDVTDLQSGVINDNFVETSLDEATGDMFELLSGLHQQIAASIRKLNRDAFPSVPCPDVESRIPRPSMDCQEIEIRVKPGQNGVLLPVFDEVRCGRSKKVASFRTSVDKRRDECGKGRSPVSPSVREGLRGDTETGRDHVCDIFDP